MTDKKHSDWPEVVEWAEAHGLKNLQEKLATAEWLSKEAQNTLTIILAGVGGSLAFATQAFEPKPLTPVAFGACCFGAYLLVLGFWLVIGTMSVAEYPSPYQEPLNLLEFPDRSLVDNREGEIRSRLQLDVDAAKAANNLRASRINVIRYLLMASPFAFLGPAYYRLPPQPTKPLAVPTAPSSQPSSPARPSVLLTPSSPRP